METPDGGLQPTGPKPTPATPLPVSVPAREKCVMPPGLDNPVDVQKFLDGCNSQDLVDLLSTEKGKSATGKLRFQLCYRELKRRRAIEEGNAQ